MSYAEDGYEVVPRIVPTSLCLALKIQAQEFEHVPHIPMAHRVLPLVQTCMSGRQIVEKVTEMIGEPSAITSEYFFGRPGTKGFNCHQDNTYVQAPKLVSCWIALTNVDEQNGCLIVYPGSHKAGLLPIERVDPDNRVDACVPPLAYRLRPIPMNCGDAIFFDGHLVHGSFNNESQRHRASLTIGYIPKGTFFRSGRHHRVEISVT